MMSRFAQFLALFCLIMTCCLTQPAAAAPNDEDAGLEDNMSYHLYDDIDLVSSLKFEYGKPRIIIKSVFPQLVSDTDKQELFLFNETAKQTVSDTIADFRKQVKDNEQEQKKLPKDKVSNNLYLDYSSSYVRAKRQHILSIRYSIKGFITGNKRSYSYHQSYNYNLDEMQTISLDDLFVASVPYLQVISNYSRQTLYQRLKDHDKVDRGTNPDPDHFAIWNIQPDGLLFTFDASQVADASVGTQTVLIPYDALQAIMNPESPLMDCVKSKSRCLNNNMLTGGFIDEA